MLYDCDSPSTASTCPFCLGPFRELSAAKFCLLFYFIDEGMWSVSGKLKAVRYNVCSFLLKETEMLSSTKKYWKLVLF